ncbi:MAG: sensor histidine kinase, partial [Cereibacter changlensis]
MPPQTADPAPHPAAASATQRRERAEAVRPILQALARMIVTDRRAVVLASPGAEILLANLSAQRLGIGRDQLLSRLDWPGLRAGARRAGSAPVTWQLGDQQFDGELVHVPLGPADSYMLRLAESDQEATWLRNRARSALLMRVAHDLRTPIQSLLTAADGLTRPGGESAAEASPRIRRAAELALDHIGNVLAVVRGEQSQKGSQPDEDFRIVDELTSLVAMIDPIARARATELQLSVDAPAGLTLFGPLRFVRALCQNLIDNSVHHGGGRIELRLSCAPLAEALPGDETGAELWGIRLELADEGGGLPSAQRARLMRALGLPPDEAGGEPVASGQRPSAGLEVLAHALRQLGGRMTIADRGADGAPLAPGGGGRVIGTLFTVSLSLPRAPDQPQAPTAPPAAG